MPRFLWPVALFVFGACTCAVAPSEQQTPAPIASAPCPVPAFDEAGHLDETDFYRHLSGALEAFDVAFDSARWNEALSCAQVAARLAPDEPVAHLNRALALDGLGLWHDAHLAYGRALALGPGEPEVLRAFADFLLRNGADDGLETALVMARSGRELAMEPMLQADLALVEARAANVLGRSDAALAAAETALALDDRSEALVERGIALFELTLIEQAHDALAGALKARPDDPRALHWSGLVAQQLGHQQDANRLLQRAAKLDPLSYPLPLELSADAFAALVESELASLPAPERIRLQSQARVRSADLPSVEELRDPLGAVLSPTILGLFVPGPPDGRSDIVLYRKNLLRVVRDREALRREIRDTLLHELGHVAGMTDAQLRDRGL